MAIRNDGIKIEDYLSQKTIDLDPSGMKLVQQIIDDAMAKCTPLEIQTLNRIIELIQTDTKHKAYLEGYRASRKDATDAVLNYFKK